MKRILLLTTCLLGGLVAADPILPTDQVSASPALPAPSQWRQEKVGEQINAWKEIHAAKRKILEFSNTETNFPPVLDRINYMAGYVLQTIHGIQDREAAVDSLMEKAESLLKQEKLTFQEAASLFDRLAMTSDTSIPLDKQKQSKWGFSEGEVERNLAFLCVPKGGLSIARFADECLSEFPLRYVVLPNQSIEGGPHGSDHSIYEFFNHDRGHANQGDAVIWSKLLRGLEKIRDCHDTLDPKDNARKSIDVFLFRYFHETSSSYNDCWTCQPPCPGHDLERDLETFAPFINRLRDMSKIYPFHQNDSYLILSGDECLKEFLIRHGIISGNDRFPEFSVRQTDEGFVLDVSLVEHPISIPCDVEFYGDIETATKPVLTRLKLNGEKFSCKIRSQQLEIAAFFDDPLYLLKYAGVTTLCNGSDLPEHVVPDNVFAVAERFNQLMDDAAKLIIHAVQKHASETPSVSEHPSTSSFKRTDRKDGKEK
jgi:hypothetical protein